jgi:hypothetical protein
LYSYSAIFTTSKFSENSAPTAELHEFVSSVKFIHTSQSESVAKVLNNYPTLTFKTSPFKLFLSLSYHANLFASKYFCYHFFSHNLIARFAQADIIFPFHYFW